MRNYKIFFFAGAFLSIYSHLLKKSELSYLCRKQGRKRPLDTPKRMIERRERNGERGRERRRERERER